MIIPTIILPGYLAGAKPYQEMASSLQEMGFPAVIVPLQRRDWFPTVGGRSMLPILQKLDQTVQQVMAETKSDRVNLVGHSAGGWVSRIYLGEIPYDVHAANAGQVCLWKARTFVHTLITLGTPHVSQERWTKRNLDFVKNNYPGAFYEGVRYVCVAGKASYGDRTWQNWLTYSSYELTCGQGNCWGDGITPVESAHLVGAENITLENVWHSPRPQKLWYGTPDVVRTWATYLSGNSK
ncbi:MAG: lipase [Leptolyngbyaceae cyanobacterium CSU_1_4]|nr:lipase [Leptolyngbyaceae cyanobacterium CSU_1_4]